MKSSKGYAFHFRYIRRGLPPITGGYFLQISPRLRSPAVAGGACPVALGSAYVRSTRYEVRFGEFPRLRASLAEQKRGRNYGATYGRS